MKQPHAFVIDDDKLLGEAFKQALEMCGFSVTQITDSTEALPLIFQHKPDVILLDMQMPKLNGAQILEAVHDHPDTAHIKVIVASANHLMMDEDVQRRAHLILQKPVSLSQIVAFAKRMVK